MRVNHEFCGHYSCALCVHSSAGQAATGYQRQANDRACLERARESGAEHIIVATDHEDVARAVEAVGEVCMTRADHQSGTERPAEVVEKCGFSDDTVIVNVQGDEPMIPAVIIRRWLRIWRNVRSVWRLLRLRFTVRKRHLIRMR